ncbi:MAG: hypothetical protein UX08_C0026G0006 [Candidatus Collierbacteria bacterium GW2011_GWB1_45_35]|uniref:Uncharacterized protein n=2 Tax=Candidatus Collieribacteriota TaxID=1752725 RepID=A0A0G1KQT3_9BACT|nr:MAG: hypothetical protein UW84_C0021G0009 [Candidatus Collierbacteria bacterium GW2011_GWA2_44_99]KKT94435.1 MAG: hypothetical protein UW96_C0021G0008 [Candidatus Collierbacteria bacterium GW2011_GWA1_45_15]KKT99398.1 MAG: hypothetical protein UX01_C0010G0030 [Candidatus Collierbacteria bacterium GW2011_GWB2_45_17]KKU04441.1 MAG: hypothetical protein UX08_C0026G0006 [Candidatus Collierbacteria bacterium GW2011_GWB1_45_35]HBC44674.1 hypothetical protein [Candidatus Collierbacteria bacterium]
MIDKQFQVIVFQTNTFGNEVLIDDGVFVGNDSPVRKAGANAYIAELGSRGFKFVSQIQVKMFNGEYRINWVFERQLN